MKGIGDKVEYRNPELVGGALAYTLERLTEEELRALFKFLHAFYNISCECCLSTKMEK